MFRLGALGYAVRHSTEIIDATTLYGTAYYSEYLFSPPAAFAEVLDADVKINTPAGLWWSSVINMSAGIVKYYVSNPQKVDGFSAQMTFSVFGLLV